MALFPNSVVSLQLRQAKDKEQVSDQKHPQSDNFLKRYDWVTVTN